MTCRGSFGAWEWHLAPGACEIGLSGPWTEGLVADLWKADAERIVRFTVEARFLPSGVIREVYLSNIRMVLQPGELRPSSRSRRPPAPPCIMAIRAGSIDQARTRRTKGGKIGPAECTISLADIATVGSQLPEQRWP